MRIMLTSALLLVMLCISGAAFSAPPPTMEYVGLLKEIGDSRDSVVIVNFWATWCAPCRQEMPHLNKISQEFADQNVKVIGISLDQDKKAVERFLSKTSLQYPIYMGANSVARAYRISAIPRTVIYDTNGKLALSREGFMDATQLRTVIDALLKK